MVYHTQNNSHININDHHNESEHIVIQGNNNQVHIDNCNCFIELMGNGNILVSNNSRVKMEITGNGNQISLTQTIMNYTLVSGNANQITSLAEIEPIVINQCRGFGNTFPQNAVNRQPSQINFNHERQQQQPIFNFPSFQPISNLYQQNINSKNDGRRSPSYNYSGSKMFPFDCNNSNRRDHNMMDVQNFNNNFGYNNIDSSQDDDQPLYQAYRPKRNEQQQLHAQQKVRRAQQQARRVQMQAKRIQEQQRRLAKQQQRRILQQNRQMINQQRSQDQEQRRNQQEQARKYKEQVMRQQEQAARQLETARRQQQELRQLQVMNLFGGQSGAGNRANIFDNPRNYQHNNSLNINHDNRNIDNHNHNNAPQVEDDDRGLSQNQINRLIPHSYTGPEQDCMICFLGMQRNDETTFLYCFHSFHSYCIQTWLKKCPKCPICNDNVRKNL